MNIVRFGSMCLYTAIVVFMVQLPLHAQVIIDPQDEIYVQMERWEAAGIIKTLPSLRPLPTTFMRTQLELIAASDKASPMDKALAGKYLREFGLTHVGFEGTGRTDFTNLFAQANLNVWGQGSIEPWLDTASHIDIWLLKADSGLLLPANTRPEEDFIADDTGLAVGGQAVLVRQFAFTALDITPVQGLRFHVGLGRNSVGPFGQNGIVLGPQAPATGAFSVQYDSKEISFINAFFPIVATKADGSGNQFGKSLFYHELDFYLSDAVTLGIFETAVSGRVEPLYFVPFASYFHSQSVVGFADNTMVGFNVQVQADAGLRFKGVILLDDLNFNDILRLQFNTKWKFASQLGVSWIPAASLRNPGIDWLRSVSFDWTAVMPYMYTHEAADGAGYLINNYTNRGENMGPAMLPNSDRYNLAIQFMPDPALIIDLGLRFTRHGNASEGITSGSGDLNDSGRTASGEATYTPPYKLPDGQVYTRFLTQAVTENTLQATLGVQAVLPLSLEQRYGNLKAMLSYTFEQIWNPGFRAGAMATGGYVELTCGYWY